MNDEERRVRRPRLTKPRLARVALALLVWLVAAGAAGAWIFTHSSREISLASHDAIVTPTFDGWVKLRTGPVLPDLRVSSGSRVGADVYLGKTDVDSLDALAARYAAIASQPDGQIVKLRAALVDQAYDAALWGALVGVLPLAGWWLIGVRRRRELGHRLRRPVVAGGLVAALVVTIGVVRPWQREDPALVADEWVPLRTFVGDVTLPDAVPRVWVHGDVTTQETQRLIESALDTYDSSHAWYAEAAATAATLAVREPEPGETVVALVSDRHDNIGMDPVARAIADRAGATAVFDAGDDTSTGSDWEAFSLDSLDSAFEGYDRYAISGNHDHGDFVGDYLAGLGWTGLDGTVTTGPGGIVLLGADDPRSSGLGNWRDQPAETFAEARDALADTACASEERVATLLVHDANMGRVALERGCVDLVVGGHLHVSLGPTEVTGENGRTGHSYTTSTTGGAAYAIALGGKPRRDAGVSLLTYREGRPVGVQLVTLRTDGRFVVGDFVELTLN